MRLALSIVALLALTRGAVADPLSEPMLGRALTAPTAWLPPAGALVGSVGTLHTSEHPVAPGMVDVGIGLGGLASLDVGTDDDVRGCTAGCKLPTGLWLGRAAFRVGARQDAWFSGMPALVVGVRTTFAARGHDFGSARVTDAYVVASRELGEDVTLHGGVAVTAAGFGDRSVSLSPTARGFGGLEWTPRPYPKTAVLADVMWVPRFAPDRISLEWVADWGVRYQAFPWGAIELGVRHRQDEGLSDSTVLIRLDGAFAPKPRGTRPIKTAPAATR